MINFIIGQCQPLMLTGVQIHVVTIDISVIFASTHIVVDIIDPVEYSILNKLKPKREYSTEIIPYNEVYEIVGYKCKTDVTVM